MSKNGQQPELIEVPTQPTPHRPRRPRTTLVRLPTAASARHVVAALADRDGWQPTTDRAQIVCTPRTGDADVSIACSCEPPDAYTSERALDAVAQFGAAAAQVLFGLANMWLERNRNLPYDRYVEASVSDLLRYMGRAEKRKGGYARDDLLAYGHIVYMLSNLSVPRTEAFQRGRERGRERHIIRIERLINVEYFEMEESLFPGGRNAVLRFKYHLGSEVHSWLCGPRPQYRDISGRLLQYHPRRERFHILVGFALAFYDRANARRARGDHRIHLASLLRLIGEDVPDLHPSRYVAQVRRAIDGLRADGVIPGIRLCEGCGPVVSARQATQRIVVEFPRLPTAADLQESDF